MIKNRLESGPIQDGEDWPGLFLRGDTAMNYAINLKELLDFLDKHEAKEHIPEYFTIVICKNLLNDLFSCRVHDKQKVQKVINLTDVSFTKKDEMLWFINKLDTKRTLKSLQGFKEEIMSIELSSEEDYKILDFKIILINEAMTQIENKINEYILSVQRMKEKMALEPELKNTFKYWISDNESTIEHLRNG